MLTSRSSFFATRGLTVVHTENLSRESLSNFVKLVKYVRSERNEGRHEQMCNEFFRVSFLTKNGCLVYKPVICALILISAFSFLVGKPRSIK